MKALMQRAVDLVAAFVLLVALVVFAKAAASRWTKAPEESDAGRLPLGEFSRLISDGHWLGPRDAPVVILVYSTYACGFSGDLHRSLTELRRRYPRHLSVVIKPHVEPVRGAELDVALAAECAAEVGRFGEFHAAAFANAGVVQHRNGWRTIA